MRSFIYTLLVFCMICLSACNKEQNVIKDYSALVEELETTGDDFTEQQWEDFSQRCENVESEMAQYNFNKEQKQEIRKLQGRMAAAIGKHSGTLIKNAAQEAVEQIKAFSDGFMEGLKEDNDEE